MRRSNSGRERGVSLIELLISIGLGVTLSAVMVSLYLGSKRGAFHDEQMARMQENARYALRLMSGELAMAGFYGGSQLGDQARSAAVGGDCADVRWALSTDQPLQLVSNFPGDGNPVSTAGLEFTCLEAEAIAPETDIVAIKRTAAAASLRRGVVADTLTRSSGALWYLKIESEQLPLWEKLRPIDLSGPGYANPEFNYWEAVAKIFFVRTYSQTRADAVPTLCMEVLAGNAMTARCLVEGVENLQFEFGIDTDLDGTANLYTQAPDVEELQQAVAVRIHLLLRSVSAVSGHVDTKTYHLGRREIAPARDAYLRRVFSATVLLRNRVTVLG